MYINLQISPKGILQGQMKREINLLNLQLKHPILESNHVPLCKNWQHIQHNLYIMAHFWKQYFGKTFEDKVEGN